MEKQIMELTRIKVTVHGTKPLLVHRFAEEESGKSRKKATEDSKTQAEKALYTNADGPYAPSSWFEGAMVKAGVNFSLRGKKTYKDLVKSAVVVTPEEIPLRNEWEVDSRPVVISGRIMRHRPKFKEWSAEFTVEITDPQLPANVLQDILKDAGQYCGVGDYRPKFGTFEIVEFKEI
jgi:hypothetical protein